MAELRIPPEFVQGYLEIRHLEDDQVRELASALREERPTTSRADLRKRLAEKVSIAPEGLREVLAVLYTLYPVRDDMGVPMTDVVDAICDAMDASDVKDLRFYDEAAREIFKNRMIELLDADSLDVTAQATDLLWEYERTVHGKPRVLTDVRPLFGASPEDPPRGALTVHTLKFDYHQDGELREFFITLDDRQIDDLVEVLARASLKAQSLKRVLVKADIPHIDVDKQEGEENG